MSRSHAPHSNQIYAIRIGEHLDDDFATWFGSQTVDHAANGETTLIVHVRDQAELHGLLIKVRDLNLTLIEIVKVEP
jgi:hypothetical protein